MNVVADAAWHEAGHAIVAKRLDCGDVRAEVQTNGSGTCFYRPSPPLHPGDLEPMRRAVMIGMAGHIAEAVARGEAVPSAMQILTRERKAGASAILRLVEKAGKLFDGELLTGEKYVRALLDGCHAKACQLVEDNWGDIEQFAGRLAVHGHADLW